MDKNAGVKILIVDDVEIEVTSIEEELCLEGYLVDTATNGRKAVAMAKRKKYDIVFIDLIMPEMNGIQTCKAIKEVSPDSIPILFTGQINTDTFDREIEFMNAGGELYYIYKPFKEGEILETVKQVLARRRKE